jgi:hypothetical protein
MIQSLSNSVSFQNLDFWGKETSSPPKCSASPVQTHTHSASEYSLTLVQLQLQRALSGLLWFDIKGTLTTAIACSPESSYPGKQIRTKCSCSSAVGQLRTVACITLPKSQPRHNPPFRCAHSQQGALRSPGLVQDSREDQGVLNTTRECHEPVKVTQDQQEKTPVTSRGFWGTSHPSFLPGSQLMAVFLSINFISTPGKLLPEVQSKKCFYCWNTEVPTFIIKCIENDATHSKAQAME